MAQLDRFFAVLVEKKAVHLKLCSGQAPVFVFDDGPRPASSARPGPEQLLSLLAEVLPAEQASKLRETGSLETGLDRPGIPPLTIRASVRDDRVEAVIALIATEQHSEPAPPVARSTVAPPAAAAPVAAAPTTAPPAATIPETPSPTAPPPADLRSERPPIDQLFRLLVESGGSDLHLSSCETPMLRVDGEIRRLEGWAAQSAEQIAALLEPITPEKNQKEFDEANDTDFAYEIPGLARFRANIFRDRKGPGAVFRVIPSEILTAEDLNLSSHVLDLCMLNKGLVLVTGPTGSGKSTTLCAMVDYINKKRADHVITIEDPIEFVHENQRCLMNQREVGTHTSGFKRALRAALREDPDIILVGEMRDLETIAIAIETAETGHLVFGTLHTTTAVSTVDRIVDQFPADRQAQVRTMLSESLKGVIAQTLCKKIGGGRVAALEVLIGIPSIANLVREGKTFQIPSIMQTGKKHGMITLNDALMNLVKEKLVEPQEAYLKSIDKLGMTTLLKSAGFTVQTEEAASV